MPDDRAYLVENDDKPTEYKAEKKRWYILLVASFALTLHAFLWDFWGPIARSLEAIYGWGRPTIATLGNYGSFVAVALAVPGGYFFDYFGLRKTTVSCFFVLFVACLIRSFYTPILVTTVLSHISAVLTSLPGVFSLPLPVAISAMWFPPEERMLSSTIGMLMNEFGVVFSFLVGPLVVQEPGAVPITTMETEYFNYTRAICGLAGALLILVLVYFPEKPKTPVSASAEEERTSFWSGMWTLLKNPTFWIFNTCFSLDLGFYLGLLPILNLFLKDMGLSQDASGYIGFATTGVSTFAGMFFGGLAGKYGHPKAILSVLHGISIQGAVWLLLNFYGVVPSGTYSSGIAVVLYGVGSAAMVGIIMELTIDSMYPVSEQAVATVMGISGYVIMLILLGVATLPQLTLTWVPWAMVTVRLIGMVCVWIVRPQYHRGDIDKAGDDLQAEANGHGQPVLSDPERY